MEEQGEGSFRGRAWQGPGPWVSKVGAVEGPGQPGPVDADEPGGEFRAGTARRAGGTPEPAPAMSGPYGSDAFPSQRKGPPTRWFGRRAPAPDRGSGVGEDRLLVATQRVPAASETG